MNTRLLSLFVGTGLMLAAVSAWADKEVDAGRITVVFKESAWSGSEDLAYNHELMSAQGTFRGKSKVMSLAAPDGSPLGVMYVGASYPQANIYNRRGECGTDNRIYVRDFNDSRLENFRCVYAGGPYTSVSLLANNALRYLGTAAKTVNVTAPTDAYFVRVAVTARGGYLMDIEVMLAPGFVGLPDSKPMVDAPALLRPGVAAWADVLAEAALKALTSFSGKLVVPPVEFANAPK